MSETADLAGVFQPKGTSIAFRRFGYGAIHLAGDMAWGPPDDRDAAVTVVREAVRLGINHIDTADFYGPNVANEIIREALHPYPEDLVIVTKVGRRRGADKSWLPALASKDLINAVHANLRDLGLDVLDVVNLRVGGPFSPDDASIAEPFGVLVDLQTQGLIRHIGLSNVSPRQFEEASAIARIVCVQNRYNVTFRQDDAFIDVLSRQGLAYVPFHPIGGFRPLAADALEKAASSLGATTRQVALAWLLQRAPNILVIAGTSSVDHLRENLKAAALQLPKEIVALLDKVAMEEPSPPHR